MGYDFIVGYAVVYLPYKYVLYLQLHESSWKRKQYLH